MRRLLRLGIRHRLIFLMAIAAGALALDSYLDITARRNQRVVEAKERMALAAQNAAVRQYEFTSAARLLLTSLARPGTEPCGRDFHEFAKTSQWLKAISIADTRGMLMCSSSRLDPNVSVADREYYQDAIRTRGFVMSDYVVGRVQKAPVILAAAPRINENNEIDAVIILTIDMGWLNRTAQEIGGADSHVLLVDRKMTVAAANERARGLIGRNLADHPVLAGVLRHEGEAVSALSEDGVARLHTAAPLAGSEARLLMAVPESRILAPADRAARTDYLKNASFFVVLFALAWMLAESLIIRPIRSLTRAASALGGANYAARVDVETLPADFAELAETFNTTAVLLQRKEELIAEQNQRLREANRRLSDLANLDELTGIANRRVLNDRLQDVFRDGTVEPVALLVVDLDKFKPVNDLLGHPVGDMVLKEAAARLSALTRRDELVARLGGDEFAVLVSCAHDFDRPRKIAEQIVDCMSTPFVVPSGHADIGATVGVALAEEHALNRSELLRAADLAMYAAKRSQRGSYCFFEPNMQEEIQARAAIEAELRAGIRAGEIVPYFQPIVGLETSEIVGFEILARWKHPSRGVLTPDSFIALAAEAGLVETLTRHVLGAACREARHWPSHLILSINLSPNQLDNPLLPTLMSSIAIDCGIAPNRIEIEITEEALIEDFSAAQMVMQAFRALGMKIALDDFGTGYSNMQNLHELRFDKIKIDRSFIMRLSADGSDRTLVTAILAMVRNLGLPATAEGVEDEATAILLRQMGCTYAQGFLYGRPMPAPEAARLLKKAVKSGAPGAA